MHPPLIRFQSPRLPPLDAVAPYFKAAEEAAWFSNGGPCVELLSTRLTSYIGSSVRCLPVANATLGLMIGLRALAGRPGGARHIVVPSFTFAAGAAAIEWAGYVPLFVDVHPDTWHLDPEGLAAAFAEHDGDIAAVLACSTFGTAPPLEQRAAWEDLCRTAGVGLLVDSAAGFGSLDEAGRPLGGQGDIEVFSFHATKPLAIGEGGAVCTQDPDLLERLAQLSNFGFGPERSVDGPPGINAKLAELPAAVALAALDTLGSTLAARRERAIEIMSRLEGAGFGFQPGARDASLQFVSALSRDPDHRDRSLADLAAARIEARTYYSPPLHLMPAWAGCPRVGRLPVSVDLSERMLSLPMANDLDETSIDRICEALGCPR